MIFRICLFLIIFIDAATSAMATAVNSSMLVNSTASKPVDEENGLWNLMRAVCIIMTVIVLGYLARLFGYMTAESEQGIGAIAGRVALPVLLASSIANADIAGFIKDGGLEVIAVDLVCKLIIVLVAMLVALLQPQGDVPKLSLMGAYGVFVTNSNYMAIGVPLLTAIFGNDKILYLVFFAMVQNILINPILFGMILLGLAKDDERRQKQGSREDADSATSSGEPSDKGRQICKSAMWRVATDPIVMAAVIGLIFNLFTMTDGHPSRGILQGVVDTLSNAFAACALFNLGMGIVGHLEAIVSRSVVVPLILIILKSLALPMLEKSIGEYFLAMEITEVLWVAGCISTATSTALVTSAFLPSLGGIFRGATVLNLILSLPLLLLSQTLFKSDDDVRGEITQYGRVCGNILSMVGLAMLLLNFYAVKRWSLYPMWLLVDLAVIGLPFYVGHYFCHVVREVVPFPETAFYILYFITNVSRVARRVYMMALSFILLLQVRWHRWFPDTPFGYIKEDERGDQACDTRASGSYHTKMRAMHWIARISSVGFGVLSTVPFMLFAPLHPLSGFSCWCAYGVPQWTFETISFSIITVLQGIALVSFLIVNTRREWRYDYGAKVFPRVKFGMSTLLILQFIALLMHLLLIAEILQIGQENFEVDPIWLQPLVVLILITDGGGFVLMFIFSTSDTTWETYRKIWYTSWVRVAGETQTRMLRNLALHMVTDPKLMDSYRPNYSVPRQANTFSGCDAVDWMLKHGDCACRDEAFQRCIQMQQKKSHQNSGLATLVEFHRCRRLLVHNQPTQVYTKVSEDICSFCFT
jgi:predicted permease